MRAVGSQKGKRKARREEVGGREEDGFGVLFSQVGPWPGSWIVFGVLDNFLLAVSKSIYDETI